MISCCVKVITFIKAIVPKFTLAIGIMKSIFFLGILFLLACSSCFFSCTKSYVSSSEDVLLPLVEVIKMSNRESERVFVPTKKAYTYTITDHETGQVQTYYVCRNPGRTCDVGDTINTPPPPNTRFGNGESVRVDYRLRNQFIQSVYGLPSEKIKALLDSKRELLLSVFPILYDEFIQNGLRAGTFKCLSGSNYIAIVSSTNHPSPIYVYMSVPALAESLRAASDSTKLRLAVYNTQTGVIECIKPGTNCFVGREGVGMSTSGDLLETIDGVFPGKELGRAVLSGSYTILESPRYVQVAPVGSTGPSYYLLK
jgi:hypothetical protein